MRTFTNLSVWSVNPSMEALVPESGLEVDHVGRVIRQRANSRAGTSHLWGNHKRSSPLKTIAAAVHNGQRGPLALRVPSYCVNQTDLNVF